MSTSTLLTINVTNLQSTTQNFFFFQQPAIYVGGQTVYSNSLYQGSLGNSTSTGGKLTFLADLQFYAGVQQGIGTSIPQVGQTSGYASAAQPIALTPAQGQANNTTTMSLGPLALSPATYTPDVEPGAFRIAVPSYNSSATNYNAGSAVFANGSIVLSNFVQASPLTNTDAQPILKYYVATGTYTPGTVMNFTQSSTAAAVCDFTTGYTVANVAYNPDGTWTVTYPS